MYSFYAYIKQRISINNITSEKYKICETLQYKIEDYISEFNNNISVSLLNYSGDFIVDVNGKIPRIPASNQKILSSAFALDKLGPSYTLNTHLNLINNGDLYIDAAGDPDFDQTKLQELVRDLDVFVNNSDVKLHIIIKESDSITWWPSNWSYADRKQVYGAPITKYSIASNSSISALINPINNFSNELQLLLKKNKLSKKYFIKIVNENYPIDYVSTINSVNSAPLYVLLNLVNSESHNFTSEVIFRHSINDWSHNFPNQKYNKWLEEQNFTSDEFFFDDASGLSRKNRVTTYGIAQFLRRMKLNRFANYYYSSFSILGMRGSLANVNAPENLKGRILAKSGTLNNVKSVSGIILGKRIFFSIIINDMDNSLRHIINILSIVDNSNYCN